MTIPIEILNDIFQYLEFEDLYMNVTLVCQRWNQLISNAHLLPRKTIYLVYISKEGEIYVKFR